MKLSGKKRNLLQIALLGFVMTALGLAGCRAMESKAIGRKVASGARVVLQEGGPHAQTFRTGDMSVKYQYWKVGKHLKVLGTTAIRYESINALTFHLYFLDDQGWVIAVQDFHSFLDHSDFTVFKSNTRQYHRDFTIPDGAKAFAIGYAGETAHMADQDRFHFSYSPLE